MEIPERVVDLTGLDFGRLHVIEFAGLGKHKWAMWECKCECGNEKVVYSNPLRTGAIRSCGCSRHEFIDKAHDNGDRVYKYEADLKGMKFGKLTAIEIVGERNKRPIWKCLCECGNYIEKPSPYLVYGKNQSCGCGRYGKKKEKDTFVKKHKRLHNVWWGMKQRCNSASHTAFKYYGGKGIKVCEEWLDFENFCKWAMENGYNPTAKKGECTLDRIDVNGDYCPQNCRWVGMKTQGNNKTDNHWITMDGETKTLQQWAEEYGKTGKRVSTRISRGWNEEKAVKAPNDYHSHYLTINGRTMTAKEWANETGVNYSVITSRMSKGWSDERVVFEKSRDAKRRFLTINGQRKSMQEWEEITGIKRDTIAARIDYYGMSPEEAITKPVRKRGANR